MRGALPWHGRRSRQRGHLAPGTLFSAFHSTARLRYTCRQRPPDSPLPMTTPALPRWKQVSLALRIAVFAYPVASYLLQALVFAATGWHLRAGDAAIHLIWSGVVGVIGLILVLSAALRARKNPGGGSIWRTAPAGVLLALVIAALELYSHDVSRFCGGSLGACGSWN